MKIFSKLVLFLAMLPLVSFVSCNKEEGEGGKAKISGVVYKVVDGGDIAEDFTFVRDTVVASDIDVFIIYGGDQNDVYDDKTKTSHNGRFEFDYLREGDYSVYAYNDNDSYVMNSVHCSKKGTTEVPPMFVLEGKNSGKCGIVGYVMMSYASKDDLAAGVATRVYVRKDGEMSVSDTRTDDKGRYNFSRLEPNTNYIVWVEFEKSKNGRIVAVSDTVNTGLPGNVVMCKTLTGQVY